MTNPTPPLASGLPSLRRRLVLALGGAGLLLLVILSLLMVVAENKMEELSLRGPRGDMGVLGFGDLTVDPASGRATRAGVELKLGKIPFQILTLLVKRAPQLVTRQEVLDTVWGDEEPDSDALRSHIYALRSALDKPFPTPMLETLHGQGYRLVTP